MLLQQNPALEELLIEILVQSPGATAKEIDKLLESRNQSYTLRAIYKELAKLESQGIIFKLGQNYNVRLAWIMKVSAFGDLAYERYTQSPYLMEIIQRENAVRVERFNDLRKLDRLWTQLILALHSVYPNKLMCLWCPYQWFYLAHYYTAKQFYEAIDLSGYKRYHIIGSDTYLGRLALKDLPKKGTYSFAESPFHKESRTYYTVVADCLITVKLDAIITERLEQLFNSVHSQADIRPNVLETIFASKVRASLTFERNQTKANRIKKKFSAFFGIEIN